jgi:hypothetical protein
MHLDENALSGGEHVRGIGLGHIDDGERAVGPCKGDDLNGLHAGSIPASAPRMRAAATGVGKSPAALMCGRYRTEAK